MYFQSVKMFFHLFSTFLLYIFSIIYGRKKTNLKARFRQVLTDLTEKEGFEPSRRLPTYTLAGAPLQPLEYFSNESNYNKP